MAEALPAGLRVRELTRSYGPVMAARDLSFEVAAGEVFGLLGPNGAGKTTTLECVLGLRCPDTGSITIASNKVSGANVINLAGTGTGNITSTGVGTTDWVIDNGAITLHFDPAQFHIWGAYLDGDSNNLVDTTSKNSKDGKQFYVKQKMPVAEISSFIENRMMHEPMLKKRK